MKLWFERNSLIHIALLASSVYLGIYVSPFLFLFWLYVQLIDDAFYYTTGLSLFDPEIRIQRGYQFGNLLLRGATGDGRDYGFNLYDGELLKSGAQAQNDKWEFMLKELRLSPGQSLIDIGCGNGDWLNYAKSKGIHVVGVNISPEQAQVCQKNYGLDVICTNWKNIPKDPLLQAKLYGKFDAVTFMDTIEHYVPSKIRKNVKAQDEIYSTMFEMAAKFLKPNSSANRVFISCLHRKSDQFESIRESFVLYLLDKFHSGCYPLGEDGLTKNAKSHFVEVNRYDKTEDYRLTSVLDRNHFGAQNYKINKNTILKIPVLFCLDPHHIHKWIDIWVDGWMWWHFGDRAWDQSYGDECQKQNKRCTLWWIVLEKNRNILQDLAK
jgi:cyclopropane fatty-acyl-phospholipid synthase-like methyltransferase